MRYLLCFVFPPVAVLLCGRPVQALLNCLLTLAFVLPGVVHGLLVVSAWHADRRTDRIVSALR